jgi:hypothetical protein
VVLAHLSANKIDDTIGVYSVGFLDAAAGLFERARRGHGLVDCTFYPAAYCVRHGLELLIKQLSVYAAYEMRDPGLLYEPDHDLQKGWQRLEKHLRETVDEERLSGGETDPHDIDIVASMLEELHDLDPRGTILRYPEYVKKRRNDQVRTREDTHVPEDDIHLGDWEAKARATLAAAHSLLFHGGQRAHLLRMHRSDPPRDLQDLVLEMGSSDS